MEQYWYRLKSPLIHEYKKAQLFEWLINWSLQSRPTTDQYIEPPTYTPKYITDINCA